MALEVAESDATFCLEVFRNALNKARPYKGQTREHAALQELRGRDRELYGKMMKTVPPEVSQPDVDACWELAAAAACQTGDFSTILEVLRTYRTGLRSPKDNMGRLSSKNADGKLGTKLFNKAMRECRMGNHFQKASSLVEKWWRDVGRHFLLDRRDLRAPVKPLKRSPVYLNTPWGRGMACEFLSDYAMLGAERTEEGVEKENDDGVGGQAGFCLTDIFKKMGFETVLSLGEMPGGRGDVMFLTKAQEQLIRALIKLIDVALDKVALDEEQGKDHKTKHEEEDKHTGKLTKTQKKAKALNLSPDEAVESWKMTQRRAYVALKRFRNTPINTNPKDGQWMKSGIDKREGKHRGLALTQDDLQELRGDDA